MNTSPRLDFHAKSIDEAKEYIKNRSIQMLKFGVRLKNIEEYKSAIIALFSYQDKTLQSIYVLEPERGKGVFNEMFSMHDLPILTDVSCQIASYLDYKGYDYESVNIEEYDEYKIIQKYYGDRKSKRSNLYLMNHIDEGLAILKKIDASIVAQKAYCLHPIFQADQDLKKNILKNFGKIEDRVLIITMEYRSIANAYLSKKRITSIDQIKLSPLKDVNDMLIADKIQNRKDFEIYHQSHRRYKFLDEYFRNWLERLGVSEGEYQQFKKDLLVSITNDETKV